MGTLAAMKDSWFVGDAQDFTTTVTDYPASAGWTLHYRLVPRVSGTPIALVSSASGDDHRVFVSSTTAATWTAGEYSCFAWVENLAGERHTVDPDVRSETGATSLLVRLLPDPRQVTAYDGRSPARKALDAINAGLETLGTNAHVQEYSIGNRMMKFSTRADLLVMRSQLASEVWREDNAAKMKAGLPNPRNVGVRLVRA